MNRRRVFPLLFLCAVFSIDRSLERRGISLDAQTFEQIFNTSGFVDKTMLMKHFIKGPFHTIVNAPRKFGKTVNLDMLKIFLEIPTDLTGREDPLQIQKVTNIFTRNGLDVSDVFVFRSIQQHFIKYPIIHLDFKRVNATTLETFEQTFTEMIGLEYKRHSYVTRNATNATMAQYNRGILPVKNRFDESTGYILAMLLHQYHSQPCIVLIDNCDHPLVSTLFSQHLSESDVRRIVNFLGIFIRGLVKGNFYVTRSTLVGTSGLDVVYKSYANNLRYYHALDNTILLVKYFGFSEEAVNRLAFQFDEKDDVEWLRYWYGGFRIMRGDDIYHPRSVLNHFESGELKSFWSKQNFPLSEAFDSIEFGKRIKETIDRQTKVVIQEKVTLVDFIRLKNNLHSSNKYSSIDEELMSFCMQHLIENGVYTVDDNFIRAIEKNVTVTNHETRVRLQELVYTNKFLKEYFHVDTKNAMAYVESLHGLGENKTELFKNFLSKAHSVISQSTIKTKTEMLVVLYYPINNNENGGWIQKHMSEVRVKERKNMDMFIFSCNRDAIIIQLDYNNRSAFEALGEIIDGKFEKALDKNPATRKFRRKNKIYIGMHYSVRENLTTLSYLFNSDKIDHAVNVTLQS